MGEFPSRKDQFKSGSSGNPKGPKKGRSIVAEMRKLLDAGNDDDNLAIELAEVIRVHAKKGDHRFMTTLLDRTDGPVKQQTEGDLNIVITYEDIPIPEDTNRDAGTAD